MTLRESWPTLMQRAGAPVLEEKSCFKPLSTHAGVAMLASMGLDASRVLDCSLHVDTEPFAKLVVTYVVVPSDLERLLQALAAIPVESQP